MAGLASLRHGWEHVERVETELLRAMSAQESVTQWLRLQQAFEYQLQQTADLFAPERRQALATLQERLHKLAEWQKLHGESIPLDPGFAEPVE